DLPEIVALIRDTFPDVERVTSYARARTILGKKPAFLRAVREAGLDRLHIGLESGDPVVLETLRKGVTPGEIAKAGRKAKEAGFQVSFYVLSGAGGKDRWKEHAEGSARVCSEAKPDFIRLRTLTIQRGTPLWDMKEKGEFSLTPPLERLREVRTFVGTLDVEEGVLASDHLTNYLWADGRAFYRGVAGNLPRDREGMLGALDRAIAFVGTTELEVKDSNQLYEEGAITTL
ncbi:MAG: radical SAM protein, partial [Planctomycetota bacterium]